MLDRLFKFFLKHDSQWPLPKFDDNDQPHFLFIITPPYSGSTALAELINTSSHTMILQERGEGQWLIPGLCAEDRWNIDKIINYQSVKAVWLSTYQKKQRLMKNIDVVIEKSPPNMMRMENIANVFKHHSFLANNRDPYANCASILYSNYDINNINQDERKAALRNSVDGWIMRSKKIQELVTRLNAPLITYESFCQNPSIILSALRLPDGVSDTINVNASVKVKGYQPQGISNQNQRQIANLTDDEIKLITDLLREHEPLLTFFDYELR